MGISNAVADSGDSDGQHEAEAGGKHVDGPPPVPFLFLFSGADAWDVLAVVFGIAGALANGATFPAFAFVFGEVMPTSPS